MRPVAPLVGEHPPLGLVMLKPLFTSAHSAMALQRTRACLLRVLVLLLTLGLALPARAQAALPLADGRVMLQGFYWESYRHGLLPGYGPRRWYEIVRQQAEAIAEAGFDLIWLPPPSFAGKRSAGYNPKQYFNLSNSYGDALQQRALSARAGERVLRMARTIADLAGETRVDSQAIAEALTYRSFDRDNLASP